MGGNSFSPSPASGISSDLADVVCQPSQLLSSFIRGVGEWGVDTKRRWIPICIGMTEFIKKGL